MRKAIVIRTTGDSEIAQAIVDGMCVPLQDSEELEVVRAELAKLKEENTQLGVRKSRDASYWADMCTQANGKYGGPVRKPGKIREALLIAWAMLWETLHETFGFWWLD